MAAYITTVMQHSKFPSLKKFEMAVNALSWTEAEQLFCSLSQYKALDHIVMVSRGRGVQDPSGNSLTAVTQFFCLTQLRTLRLRLHHSILLDNDLLLEAISSWPHIRHLELTDPCLRSPVVTFRGLFAALRQCPHLHTLHILLNIVNIDIDPTAGLFQHTALQTLDITTSHLSDAEAVARIIFSAFPCVDQVGQGRIWRLGVHFRSEWDEWDEVNWHLDFLKSSALLGPHITEQPRRPGTECGTH
ncbi:hypothetical protein DFH29DRAFT_296072 [Suillus ampliporus]|nr:hypothetical protein DFH29DRAFT_296072 [Suillus ampliporus]